jgi:hypothetical protein
MPPRYAYWTILAGGLPTAFRAADRDELLPTFQRLREKHPDAEMKWFARGKLWDSPEAARPRNQHAPREQRGRDWRPGGEHRDPRQARSDARRARNEERRDRFAPRGGADAARRPPKGSNQRQSWRDAPRERPHGDPLRPDGRRPSGAKGSRQGSKRPLGPDRDRTRSHRDDRRVPTLRDVDWRDRPPRERPHGDPLQRRNEGSGKTDRQFARGGFPRNQRRSHTPPRPEGPLPDREPRPVEPTPPPRPHEPNTAPPGPPERGRGPKNRPGVKKGRR